MNPRLVGLDHHVPTCDISPARLPITIGSDPKAEIRLNHQSVSHWHCRIDQIDGRLVVLDLGSVHGTFVNGTRISESPLLPGDILSVGMLRFVLQGTGGMGAPASTRRNGQGSRDKGKAMTDSEVTGMIETALSSGRSLRDIEDYLDWRENIDRCSSRGEDRVRRAFWTPPALIASATRRLLLR